MKPSALRRMSTALMVAVTVPQLGFSMPAPALPRITHDLMTSKDNAQFIVAWYLVGYAVSMLVSGILANRFGPRRVLIAGLGLFTAASLVCAIAGGAPILAFARFIQALGGCSATVLTRLVVQARYPEKEKMRILARLASMIALTPCLAPFAGGWLAEHVGWRGLFAVMSAFGVFTAVFFGTTVASDEPNRSGFTSLRGIAHDYGTSLANSSYLTYAAAIGLVSMAHVVFVAYAAAPLEIGMHVTPTAYGGFLALAAGGYVLGARAARPIFEARDAGFTLGVAAAVCCAGGAALVGTTRAAPAEPWALIAPMVLVMFGVGMTIPVCQAGLLRTMRNNSANASGLFFFLQLTASTAYSFAVGPWQDESSNALAVIVAAPCAVFPLVVVFGWRSLQPVRHSLSSPASSIPNEEST